MIKNSVLPLLILSSVAFAQEDKPQIEVTAPLNWSVALRGGIIPGATLDTTVVQNGSTIATDKSKNKSAFNIGAEVAYTLETNRRFGFFATFDRASVKGDDGGPADTLSVFTVGPRVQSNGPIIAWAGVGLGIQRIGFGQTSLAVGTTSISIPSSSSNFIFVPRVGADIPITNEVFAGAEANYYPISFTTTATLRSGAATANMDFEQSSSVFGFYARVGIRL